MRAEQMAADEERAWADLKTLVERRIPESSAGAFLDLQLKPRPPAFTSPSGRNIPVGGPTAGREQFCRSSITLNICYERSAKSHE